MTTPRTIVFLGTHGQHNIGDELLLETFLAGLGDEHSYVVNSYDPPFTRRQLDGRFTVEVVDTALDRRLLLARLLQCDLVCFGGGSIVKELYASTGRNRYSTLLMILGIVVFTRWIARRPIAMLAVGVGPLPTRFGLRLARLLLSRVDELTVRDARSLATCRALGVEVTLVPDAVFARDRSSLLTAAPIGRAAHGPRLRVALNLNIDVEQPEQWQPFLDRLAAALIEVDARRPLELHGLPMQIGFKRNDDADVLDDFAARVPQIPFMRHLPDTAAEAARVIDFCEIVVGERFHAVVLASILGVPSYVLAYDVKVRELAGLLGLEGWSVDIDDWFDSARVADRIVRLIDERETVAEQVAARSAELAEEASGAFASAREWIGALGDATRPAPPSPLPTRGNG